jgi:phospholipid/cholesterol/gamma-HCH transport system ATP-binding protein
MIINKPIIELKNLKIKLGGTLIHNGINLSISKSEIIGIVGKSGSGKTTLMREILMLQRPDSGSVRVLDHELMSNSVDALNKV